MSLVSTPEVFRTFVIVHIMMMIMNDNDKDVYFEQCEASARSRAFFSQSYGTFKQREILETTEFLDMAYGTKNVYFSQCNRFS